jgi:6-pyruvoyltetrahydropterin/6-carboxytetrahydropterin synthase
MVESGFAAAHQLKEYEGKCEGLHGHNWRVQVMVKTDRLNSIGLGIDFKILKNMLNEILSQLDHTFLNDISPFNAKNPSSENLACFIFEEFLKRIDKETLQLDWVRVWESNSAFAQYSHE